MFFKYIGLCNLNNNAFFITIFIVHNRLQNEFESHNFHVIIRYAFGIYGIFLRLIWSVYMLYLGRYVHSNKRSFLAGHRGQAIAKHKKHVWR